MKASRVQLRVKHWFIAAIEIGIWLALMFAIVAAVNWVEDRFFGRHGVDIWVVLTISYTVTRLRARASDYAHRDPENIKRVFQSWPM